MEIYRAALIGCSRMGAFIDNEVPKERGPYSHAAGYEACERTRMIACSDLREEVMEQVGLRYGVPKENQYVDYKEMIDKERPEIVSVATQPEHRAEIVIYAAEPRGACDLCGEGDGGFDGRSRRDGGRRGAEQRFLQFGHEPALGSGL